MKGNIEMRKLGHEFEGKQGVDYRKVWREEREVRNIVIE